MLDVKNQEFLSHNAARSYPLAEHATKKAKLNTAAMSLPDDFLVGLVLNINATPDVVNISQFYISRILIYPGGVNLLVAYETPEGTEQLIGMVSANNTGQYNTTHLVHPIGTFYGLTGHLTIGTFESIVQFPGDYEFSRDGTELDEDCIRYAASSITSIQIGDMPPMTGNVKLVAGDNISLTPVETEDGVIEIVISKTAEAATEFPYIKTINNMPPDSDGNILLISGSNCLQIENTTTAVMIKETCSEPCCGCEELAQMTEMLNDLRRANDELKMFQQRLDIQLSTMGMAMGVSGI